MITSAPDLDTLDEQQLRALATVSEKEALLIHKDPACLTDATEENLEQVLIEAGNDLFRKATGIDIDDFRYLVELGLLKVDSIDGYILGFLRLENQNFEVTNNMRKELVELAENETAA